MQTQHTKMNKGKGKNYAWEAAQQASLDQRDRKNAGVVFERAR
jgi:hypothetical protein